MTGRGARWVWADHVRNSVRNGVLDSQAGHVALVLAVHYTNSRCQAWPSQQELADATGLSKRTVQRALNDLEQRKLLNVRHGHPAQTSGHVYTLLNGDTRAQLNGDTRA